MSVRSFTLCLGAGLLFLWPHAHALAQAQSQSEPQAHEHVAAEENKRPKKRVWSNEDLPNLRKPWDLYQEQMAAEEAAREAKKAEAARKAKEAKDNPITGTNPGPASVNEAETLIGEKREEIAYQVDLIRKTRHEYEAATEDYIKQWLSKKLEMLNTDLDSADEELKELEAQLEELKAKQQRPAAR